MIYNFPMRTHAVIFFFVLVVFPIRLLFAADTWWQIQTSGLETNLRGISVNYNKGDDGKLHFILWASGSNGVVLRSTDDGKSWKRLNVAGGGDLDFRGIQAFDANTAYLMAAGDGDKSRIYKTTDAGKTWKLQYTDKRPGFFLDSLACDSKDHCLALSDPVDGKFVVLSTDDGENWKELPRDKTPSALPAEGAFAASGTSIAVCNNGDIYFGTGGPAARVFHSHDRGLSWNALETPVVSGNASSGIFSVACHGRSLIAVGGNYKEPANSSKAAIYSSDSGATWHLAEQQPGGFRSGVSFVSDRYVVAIGPNGSDFSDDAGVHWKHIDALSLNAASFEGADGWAVGPKGTVARFHAQIP